MSEQEKPAQPQEPKWAQAVIDELCATRDRYAKALKIITALDDASTMREKAKAALAAPAQAEARDASQLLYEFAGYMSGHLPELHAVDVSRLTEAIEAFYNAKRNSAAMGAAKGEGA